MNIAIDLRITHKIHNNLRAYTNELWQDLALSKPSHEFIFIAGRKTPTAPSIKNLQIQQLKKLPLRWMNEKRLKRALIQLQVDRFIRMEETGFGICSFSGKNNPVKNSFGAVQQVVFAGASTMPGQTLQTPVVSLIKPACKTIITSLSWTESESIKTQYTGGRDFFLFTGSISEKHQLIELLQAFSLFKKWQQSNMQLVIAGEACRWTDTFEEKLLTYKYRSDVVVLKNITQTETAKLMAASYSVVYPAQENIFPLPFIWAMQSGKSVIATDTAANRAISDAAAWVEQTKTAEGFAKEMISLYKDENYRQALLLQVKDEVSQFNRAQMMAEVWALIEQ